MLEPWYFMVDAEYSLEIDFSIASFFSPSSTNAETVEAILFNDNLTL